MVPDHDGKARKALEAAGFTVEINSVIAAPSSAGTGAGAKLAGKLSSRGINIQYTYASAAPDGRTTAIFRVPNADIEKALKALS